MMDSRMIQDVLNRYVLQSAREVQFRLGHKTTFKKNQEWIETESESLSLSEWEDLKEACLQPDERIFLETKGYIRGVFSDQKNSWAFSFVELKENLKAHFSYVAKAKNTPFIQNAAYWEALKNNKGLHIISGFKQSGKSTLLHELIENLKKDSPQQVAVHSDPSILTHGSDENVFYLGLDSVNWETTHPFYDGIDIVILDANMVSDWAKWIHFAEEGKKVFVSLSADSVVNVLLQIKSQLSHQPELWARFVSQCSTFLHQKIVGLVEGSIHEILILKKEGKSQLLQPTSAVEVSQFESKNHYQSLNQSIIQAIVRRRFDVKTAFAISDDPEALDQQLKKMGL